MIKLIKQKRTGESQLLSKHSRIEVQDCGVLIEFPGEDNRKPGHVILIDNNSVRNLVDGLLKYLKGE